MKLAGRRKYNGMKDDPLSELRNRVETSSLTATAKRLKFSNGYIGDVLSGRKPMGVTLADRLGWTWQWVRKK